MDPILKEEYKKIAKFMGYEYVPFSTKGTIQNHYYPGWFDCSCGRMKEIFNTVYGVLTYRNSKFIGRNTHDLNFKTDLRMLFKVVEKIESLESQRLGGFVFKIEGNQCCVYSKNRSKTDSISFSMVGLTKESAIYTMCLRFIDWYNDKKDNI